MKKNIKGEWLILFACFLWGFSFTASKLALNDFPPFYLTGFKFLLGSLTLFLLRGKNYKNINIGTIYSSMLAAFLLFLAGVLLTVSLYFITPMKSGFLISFDVIFTPIFCLLLFKEKINMNEKISIFLAFLGLALINHNGIRFAINIGDLLALLGAMFYALHTITIGKIVKKYNVSLIVILQLFFAAIYSFIIAILFEKPIYITSYESIISLVLLGVFCTGLAYFLSAVGQITVNTVKTGIIFSTVPIFSLLVSKILLSNTMSYIAYIGSTVIFLSVLNLNINAVEYFKFVFKHYHYNSKKRI